MRKLIFYIDETISFYAKTHEFTERQLILFSDLATAFWSGRCIVTGHINSIKCLIESLGAPAKGIYTTIHNLHTQQGAILRGIPQIFVLTCNGEDSIETLPPYIREKSVFISLEDAVFWNLNGGCSLVGENFDDCAFYKLVGEKYCESNKLKGLKICFTFENGGGNTTHKALTNCVQQKAVPTLCIVDSDQKYGLFGPCQDTPSLGDTLHLAEKASKKLNGFPHAVPHRLFPLYVHEVENLIPLSVLSNLQSQLPAIASGLSVLERLKQLDEGKPILYYDFKHGIRYDADTPKCRYWAKIAEALGETFLPIPEEELTPAQKSGKEKIPASPPFHPVSNNRLLEKAIKWIAYNPFELEHHLAGIWDELGSVILTWGCAMLPSSG